jgi:archaellum component FlaC
MQKLGMSELEVQKCQAGAERQYRKMKEDRFRSHAKPQDRTTDEIIMWNEELKQQISEVQMEIEENDRTIADLKKEIERLKKPVAKPRR